MLYRPNNLPKETGDMDAIPDARCGSTLGVLIWTGHWPFGTQKGYGVGNEEHQHAAAELFDAMVEIAIGCSPDEGGSWTIRLAPRACLAHTSSEFQVRVVCIDACVCVCLCVVSS